MSDSEASAPASDATAGALLSARWYDGRQARGQAVDLWLQGDDLWLRVANGDSRSFPRRQVTWPERTRHGVRQLLLPDGGVVEIHDSSAWEAWAGAQGLSEALAVRWAASWRATLWATVTLLLLLVGAGVWGVPWVADRTAALVPQAVRSHIDELAMAQLRGQGWLQPSQLPPQTAARLGEAVDAMLAAAYPASERPQVQVHVYRLPAWMGPNAFALPGGQIVVSDALLQLLPAKDGRWHPGVLGVLAHEVGHVHAVHGLRNLMAASSTAVLLNWWIGDYSTLLATAPSLLTQASYSRDFEREADAEALRIMQAAGIDRRGMVEFFEALQRQAPARSEGGLSFGLATHPPNEERIRLFRDGSR